MKIRMMRVNGKIFKKFIRGEECPPKILEKRDMILKENQKIGGPAEEWQNQIKKSDDVVIYSEIM